MSIHYSQPRGFAGRNICYAVLWNGLFYGSIVGGSATLYLPNRNEFFNIDKSKLNNIVNNIFFHVEKQDEIYPCRWFTVEVLQKFRETINTKIKYWVLKVLWNFLEREIVIKKTVGL